MLSADKPHIKVLIIEDDDGDAALISRFLSKARNICFDIERADRMSTGIELLENKHFDVVLSDLGLPDSIGIKTFEEFYRRYPDLPVILLTGLDDETTALSAVQSGAQDYLVKGQIDTRQLIRSIQYAIERRKLVAELEKRLKEIKTLRGLLPMCAWCRDIRDDHGYWKNLEAYVREHTDAAFTHGICPKCMKTVYPDLYEKMLRDHPELRELNSGQTEEKQSGE